MILSLNHPNIAHIYGVEERALVMELVEGESPKGQMPFEDAWKIAMQIADALEYAHERGVIHRDLKPANVKVTPEGVVKLLDFGLAKAFSTQPDSSGTDPENSPTLTLGATVAGTVLGTAAYMAPEQAKGKRADKRADIWSWGVVLYELLTGERLFKGEDTADTLAQVLTKEPALERVPPNARRVLQECLQRDPKQRLRDIGDAKRLLGEQAVEAIPARSRLLWLWPGAAALFLLAGAALAFVHFREQPPPTPQMLQYTIEPPPKTRIESFNISPDGGYIAIAANGERGSQLWVRGLDSLQPQPLAGTEGARLPFWSPNSRDIGYFAGGQLKKVSLSGGTPQRLCDVEGGGGTWNSEGVILFGSVNGGLGRITAAGGVPSQITEASPANIFPTFLPDGHRFLYLSNSGIYIGSLDAKAGSGRRRLLEDESNPQYLPPSGTDPHGYILFVREQTLMAQPVNPDNLQPAGDVFPVVDQVSSNPMGSVFFYSISRSGILVYLPRGASILRQHAWFDRDGNQIVQVGEPVNSEGLVALSPDQKRMVSERGTANEDLWITDLEGGQESRFTFDASRNTAPVWSPDGKYVAFASNRSGVFDLYRKPANQSGDDELLFRSEFTKEPTDWSPNGFIIFREIRAGSNSDLFALSESGDPKPIPLLTSRFNETEGTVSPDGRWLAYASDESGKYEVYVQPFAPAASKTAREKTTISLGGGSDPHWPRDGGELFYLAPGRKMMAVTVKMEGDNFVHGTPQALFDARIRTPVSLSLYGVSGDGKRFLMAVEPKAPSEALPLHVMVNWLAGLKR
jgi:Tol biopolymer transport system component